MFSFFTSQLIHPLFSCVLLCQKLLNLTVNKTNETKYEVNVELNATHPV